MAPWIEGGPCANPDCKTTTAAVWYGGEEGPQYCHSRPCRRLGGYLPPKGRGRDRLQDEEDDPAEDIFESCIEIKAIVGLASDNPMARLSKKQRRLNPTNPGDQLWFHIYGVFADADCEDDPGNLDRRWLQMEDLGRVSKSDVKSAIAAYEKEAKELSNKALRAHKSVD